MNEWIKDANVDRTEPGKAMLDIPKLHAKYLNILSHHKYQLQDLEFKYNRMKKIKWEYYTGCLLYTSDAADEEDSVDLGGRRIIKKKKKKK